MNVLICIFVGFNLNLDTPGFFTSEGVGGLTGKCSVMMVYSSAVMTLINREVLRFWSVMALPVNHRSPKGSAVGFHGISPTGSLTSSFPQRATCAVLCRKSPLFLCSPSYSWKDIRVSGAEPRPGIPAGQTGSRCLLVFFTLYLPFPRLEFEDPKPTGY